MGQRASDTRGISFEDVEVPAEVIIIEQWHVISNNVSF